MKNYFFAVFLGVLMSAVVAQPIPAATDWIVGTVSGARSTTTATVATDSAQYRRWYLVSVNAESEGRPAIELTVDGTKFIHPINTGSGILISARSLGIKLREGVPTASGKAFPVEDGFFQSSPMWGQAWQMHAPGKRGEAPKPFTPMTLALLDKARDLRVSFLPAQFSGSDQCKDVEARFHVDGKEAQGFDSKPLAVLPGGSTVLHGKTIVLVMLGTCPPGFMWIGSSSLVDRVEGPYKVEGN